MFVALSVFTVANGMTAEVKQAFVDRPHLVDRVAGFQRMDVISPLDEPDEVWLLTYWTDETSFRTWHRSQQHHAAHRGMPKGLKLVPHTARLRFFSQVSA